MKLLKSLVGLLAALILPLSAYAADTTLSPSTLVQIEEGASEDTWGLKLNNNASIINAWFDAGPALKVANGGTGSTTAAGARTALSVQALDASLTSLAAYNTNGLLTQTAADTFTGRTLTGTAAEITVTNGSGVAGNPTLSLPSALTFTGKTMTGGTYSGAALNGTLGATTPSTVAGTSGTFSGVGLFNNATDWVGGIKLGSVAGGGAFAVSGYNVGNSGAAFVGRVDNTAANLATWYFGASTTVGTITTNGTSATYGTTSDYRLKTNVRDTDRKASLALINAIRIHDYTWKSNGSKDRGVIAHELQALKPTAVTGVKDAKDAEGKPVMQNVDYSKLVPDLVAAVQALTVANDNLAKRVAALEARAR